MRRRFATLLWLLPALVGAAVPAAAQDKLEHPGVVALSEESGGRLYRHFPTSLRLYVYDKDSPGLSACNAGCSSAWPPLIAEEGSAKRIGDWTQFKREDGRQQWAYKSRPVYLRYHDTPDAPQGDGVDGVWHLLKP
jgi:predicted lipoprotein with Yx(FWY)xxD motif